MADENVDTSLELETEAPVTDSTPVEQTEDSTSKKEIMIPKSRFDEVTQKYKDLRQKQTPENKQTSITDVDKLIDEKLAPLRVQIETDQVLRKYSDFEEFASKSIDEIKRNPSLSLEEGYWLAKAKSGTVASIAKEEGKKEAYQTIDKKSSLGVEQSGPKKAQRPVEDMIKDRDVPLSEIAKMLPRS